MELIFFSTRFHSKQFLAWFFKIIFGKNNCIWFPTWHKKTFPEYDFFWKRVFILQKEENIHFIHEKEHLQHMEWKSLPKKNCTHLYTWRKCFPLKFHFIHLWHFFLLKKLFHLVLHMKKKILSPENVHSISPMDFWKLLFWIKNISLNIFYIWKKKKRKQDKTETDMRSKSVSDIILGTWRQFHATQTVHWIFQSGPINQHWHEWSLFCYLETRKAALNMGHNLATKESTRGSW